MMKLSRVFPVMAHVWALGFLPMQCHALTVAEQCEKESGDIAISACNELITKNPFDADAFYNRGIAWSDDKGDDEKALRDFNEAIRIKPNFIRAYAVRGIALFNLGEIDRAITDFNEALKGDGNAAIMYYYLGLAWSAKNQPKIAIENLTQSIRLKPSDADSYYHRGRQWQELFDYAKAISDFDEVVRIDRSYPDIFMTRARAKFIISDRIGAGLDADEAIRLDKTNFEAFYFRGLAAKLDKRHSAALADFDNAIRLNASFDVAYHARAETHLEIDDLPAALKDAREYVRLAKDATGAKAFVEGIEWRIQQKEKKTVSDLSVSISQRCDNYKVGFFPKEVLFFDGTHVLISERNQSVLKYIIKSRDGASDEVSSYQGIFTLTSKTKGGNYEFEWDKDLSSFFPLKVGDTVSANAKVLNLSDGRISNFSMRFEVSANQIYRLGECEVPVIEIESTLPSGKMTKFYNPEMMIALKTVISNGTIATQPQQVTEHRVIELRY
jgi:tetratricopeptide (TPR) repeat protein